MFVNRWNKDGIISMIQAMCFVILDDLYIRS